MNNFTDSVKHLANFSYKELLFKGVLKDVFIDDLEINIDDRGYLTEIIRMDWFKVRNIFHPKSDRDSIKQVYLVENSEEAIRAFHVHEKLIDLFCLIKGHAKFVLFDGRFESKTFGKCNVFNFSYRKPQLLGVPAGVFHGWKGSKGSILLSVASQLYKGEQRGEKLDEERIKWDFLGKRIWETEFK